MRKRTWGMVIGVMAISLWLAPLPVQAVETKLTALDGALNDSFGFSVSVSGDTALVGAPRNDGKGSAYVFVQDNTGGWSEQTKLTASDGGALNDRFGISVSVSGDTALVGAPRNDGKGSAYVFVQDTAGAWIQQPKLTASDGAVSDNFGASVSVNGDTALIGAPGNDVGAAYVFVRDAAGTWIQQQKLTASDGAAGDNFGGASVSVNGDTALVGAFLDDNDNGSGAGSAYVFVRDANTRAWIEQAKLLASDGAADDQFGFSVSVNGETALVGAYSDDDNGLNSGSAYVFVRDVAGAWIQQQKLTASDGEVSDQFGISVSISGETALIGAPRDDDNGLNSGSAYVFVRDAAGAWIQQPKLTASDGAAADVFGRSVSVGGETALIGASGDDNKGSAYVIGPSRFTVDNSDDVVDVDLNDGRCDVGDGTCTLRAAIQQANATQGAAVITLPAGTYTLSILSTNEDASADGDLDITDDLTITGAGSSATIIDGNGSMTGDRVFHIDPTLPGSGPSVDISDLTIRGGSALATVPRNGGGVLVQNMGKVTMTNVLVTGNGASDTGGGIHSDDFSVAIIANSTVQGNAADTGGGIGNWDDAVMTITDSTIAGNTAVAGDAGGIINENQAQLTIRRSTISGNESTDRGGGILTNNDTILTILNSTISGNRASRDGGGIFADDAPTVSLTNVTLTNNTSDFDGNDDGDGGGIFLRPVFTGSVTLHNTILAGNIDGSAGSEAPDCFGTITSAGYTLLGDDTGCTFPTAPGDQVGTGGSPIDPLLGSLQDNGGPTLTHALLAGSPAIDVGDSEMCPETDQRGAPRPVDGDNDGQALCDSGAYEFASTPPPTGGGGNAASNSGGGGGGCSLNPNAEFDPVFLVLVFLAMALPWHRRRAVVTNKTSTSAGR